VARPIEQARPAASLAPPELVPADLRSTIDDPTPTTATAAITTICARSKGYPERTRPLTRFVIGEMLAPVPEVPKQGN